MDERENIIKSNAAIDGGNFFRQGLNCAECVLMSFQNNCDGNISPEAFAMCTGFGGGFAHTKNHTCGAITGAMMALSSVAGRKDPFVQETPRDRAMELREIYEAMEPMVRELEAEFGEDFTCKSLSAPHGDFDGKTRKRNCLQMVEFCSGVAAKYAEQLKNQ